MSDMLFALPVEVRRCARNRHRFVIVSATGKVLLRSLDDDPIDQDIIERFALAMNQWSAADLTRMAPWRFGLSALKSEIET